MKKQFTFLGENLYDSNPHWVQVYGQLLIAISKMKIEETTHLLACPPSESEATEYDFYRSGIDAVRSLLESHGCHIEGYTLETVYEWFIWYVNDWHSKNKEVQIKAKKDNIQALKKELEILEKDLFKD